MHWLRIHLVLGLAWSLTGCLSTRLAHIENLEVPLPRPDPSAGWQAEIAALLEVYENAPVLVADDQRLEPLYGGLSTLSYFGADAQPRMAAQRVPPGLRAHGRSLEVACTFEQSAAAEQVFAESGLPLFTSLWVPLARNGQAVSARCDERGSADAPDGFCMFGRLALQPTPGPPLIVLVHGMFDSGAQEYMQRMAAVLYRRGYSVLLPDMRDHGETLRAAPDIATTLGTLEGPDLLALVSAVRGACGARIGRVGVLGVSAGGLDAIRAFTLDRTGSLDAGVIALSPLLDIPAAIADLSATGPCAITRSVELTWLDDLSIAALSGAAFFGGAAAVQALQAEPLDTDTAWAAAIGFGVGLAGALTIDAFFDGGSAPCVAEHAIANIIRDALSVRWRALRGLSSCQTMSPAGRRIEPEAIDLETYVHERAQFLAARLGVDVAHYDAVSLAGALRSALQAGRRDARLLVLGAADDPLTRVAALNAFGEHTAGMPRVYARTLRHGGHGAMWIVQPTVTQEIVARFFGPGGSG